MNIKAVTIVILLFWAMVCPSSAFLATKFFAWAVRTLDISFDSVLTHRDITRNAILEIAGYVLLSNPNPANADSTAQIVDALSSLSEESLTTAYYGEQDSRRRYFQAAIETISDANSDVDLCRESLVDAAAHFDSEQFQSAQNRLIRKRCFVVSTILSSNFDLARREAGRIPFKTFIVTQTG